MQKKKVINFRLMPTMMLVGIVGILSISLFHFITAIVVGVVGIVVTIVIASMPKYRKYLVRAVVLLLTYIIFTTAGGVVMLKATRYVPVIENAVVSGVVNSESDLNGEVQSDKKTVRYNLILTNGEYTKENNREKLSGKISAYLYADINRRIQVGDTVVLTADILPIKVNLTNTVSVYDYVGVVRYTLANVKCTDVIEGKPSFRESIKIMCRETMSKYPGGGMMYSMVFGDKSEMDNMFVSSGRKTGIAHIFVVSGLHLGLVAGIVGWISKKLRINKVLDFILVMLLCGIYAYLVGLGASVLRAYLMLAVYKLGKMLGLRYCGMTSLSLSVMVILLINPLTLYSVSMQLSVMAMVGILFFQTPIQRLIKTRWEKFNKFAAINISVNIAVLPITLHYFGKVSLIFFIANMLVVPIITILYPLIFGVVISTAVTQYIAYGLSPVGHIMELIERMINGLATVPFLSIKVQINIYIVIVYILVMVLISSYSMLNKRPKRIIATVMGVVVLSVGVISGLGRMDNSIKVQTVTANSNYDIVMIDIQNRHYMVVNGKLDLYKMYACRKYMSENGIDKLEGIVKAEIEGAEADILKEYMEVLNIQSIIMNGENKVVADIFNGEVKYMESIGGWEIAAVSDRIIEINNEESKIVFANNLKGEMTSLPKGIDLLYIVGNKGVVRTSPPKYLISDDAVINNISQSVHSYFTFVLKNDKIKVI